MSILSVMRPKMTFPVLIKGATRGQRLLFFGIFMTKGNVMFIP